MRTLEIQINKTRIFSLLIISVLVIFLVVLYYYSLYLEGKISLKLSILLVIAIPFLIYFFWSSLKKIIAKKPGLVIDNQGILDYMSFSEIGIISWKNITHAKIIKHKFSEYLLIGIKDNEIILNRLSGFKKIVVNKQIETFGTPIVISLDNLKIDKSELIKIFHDNIQPN
ncbi:hypothetical protein AR687_09215 [Flavobacteriaceae bacterium CRH]|nr:hypothetical protein AR687_09215 [Flavobacteriaceae bacterium CRH]